MISIGSPILMHAAVHTPRHHRPASLDREHVFHRHHERLVRLALRLGMYSSTTRSNLHGCGAYSGAFGSVVVLSNACLALPRTIGVVSPGKP